MTKQVDETLAQRGKHYGDFVKTFDVIQQIKDALKDGVGWAAMPPERRETLEMIAVKLGRLVSGDSGHADSWHDIAGYARLVEGDLQKKEVVDGATKTVCSCECSAKNEWLAYFEFMTSTRKP